MYALAAMGRGVFGGINAGGCLEDALYMIGAPFRKCRQLLQRRLFLSFFDEAARGGNLFRDLLFRG
jgi:hypothetical protein